MSTRHRKFITFKLRIYSIQSGHGLWRRLASKRAGLCTKCRHLRRRLASRFSDPSPEGWFHALGRRRKDRRVCPRKSLGSCCVSLRPRAIPGMLPSSVDDDIYTDVRQDEVFHVPQAQKYCEGRFNEWDDKITTPPGLYAKLPLTELCMRRTSLTRCAVDTCFHSLSIISLIGLGL